ncbi:MAG: oxidoreductase domain protein [Marmoricola sp.]|nr:oxidoreductase domain protein [Marmoricola sp.]
MRFGLVGTGHWATTVHAPGLAAADGVELVGVWGRDLARAEAIAAPHGAGGYDDVDLLLADVDALAFAVPPPVQAEIALRAVRAGKHLLLEKPVAMDLAVVDELVAEVVERDLATIVFFTSRFVAPWEAWLEETSSAGMLGGRADWMSSHKGKDNPYAASAWRREHGALWDVGPHMLSQLIPVLGPVVDVSGVRGAEDLVHLVLTHEGGATSRMSLTQSMPTSAVRVGLEFYGEAGWRVQPDVERDVDAAYATAVGDLVAMITSGTRGHRCDVHFGREIVDVIARCEAALSPR